MIPLKKMVPAFSFQILLPRTALGDTLMTGPTHNNLRNLRIMLSV